MQINKQITPNFNLSECFDSETAKELKINNLPNEKDFPMVVSNLENILINIAQPIRDILKKPIIISSGYRTSALNTAINGSKNSQHMIGEALDIYVAESREFNRGLFDIIKNSFQFDQLIWEFSNNPKLYMQYTYPTWIHVSLKKDKSKNRNEILKIEKTGTLKLK